MIDRNLDGILLVAGWIPGKDGLWKEEWVKGEYSITIQRTDSDALWEYRRYRGVVILSWTNSKEDFIHFLTNGRW